MFTQEMLDAIIAERNREVDQFARSQAALATRVPQAGTPRAGLWNKLLLSIRDVDLAPSRSSYS